MIIVFATFNEDGRATGFYTEKMHGVRELDGQPNPLCKIPLEAELIAEEEYFVLMTGKIRGPNNTHIDPPTVPVTPLQELSGTDSGMIRGIEDLTETLLSKGVLEESDLPSFFVSKLKTRKALRAQL